MGVIWYSDEEFILGCFVSICVLFMVIIAMHLIFQFCLSKCRSLEPNRKPINTYLQISSLICIVSSIMCSSCDAISFLRTDKDNIYELSLWYAGADSFYFIASITMYMRLIFFRLRMTYYDTIYSYSICQQLCISIPILISIPCMMFYIYSLLININDVKEQDEMLQRVIIVIMVMDFILNITTLYLFIKPLQELILDRPYKDLIRNRHGSETTEMIVSNAKISINEHKITFEGENIENIVRIISRYTILSIMAVIFNQIYYMSMIFWVFRINNHICCIMRSLTLSVRAMDNLMNVLVQYLLFHRFTKHVYAMLCTKCDILCVNCCIRRLKSKFAINARKNRNNSEFNSCNYILA